MVALNFNASQVQPNQALEAIPSGQYPVVIVRSEEKPTRAGDGFYIELEMQVQGGQYNGRKVFDRLNIKNKNEQAVTIAYSTLSAICHVTGRLNIQDTQQLHGVPFIAVVSKLERNDQPGSGNMTNEVKGYKDINGNDPGFGGQSTSQQNNAPNWANGGNQQGGGAPQNNGQQPWNNSQGGGAPQQNNAPPQNAPQQNWNNGNGQGGAAPQQNQPWATQGGVPQQTPQGGQPANGQQPPPWATQQPAA